jgi:hypothetical protein
MYLARSYSPSSARAGYHRSAMKRDFATEQVLKNFDDPLCHRNLREDLRQLRFRAAFVRNYRMNQGLPGSRELDPVLRFHLGLDEDQKKG